MNNFGLFNISLRLLLDKKKKYQQSKWFGRGRVNRVLVDIQVTGVYSVQNNPLSGRRIHSGGTLM